MQFIIVKMQMADIQVLCPAPIDCNTLPMPYRSFPSIPIFWSLRPIA